MRCVVNAVVFVSFGSYPTVATLLIEFLFVSRVTLSDFFQMTNVAQYESRNVTNISRADRPGFDKLRQEPEALCPRGVCNALSATYVATVR